jgi:type IX secretion system PorP/SprF family membrane protein
MAFAADHFFRDYSSGLGLMFVRDDQGSGQLVKQDIGLLYAYEFEVMRDVYVRPGIQFKYAEQKIDPNSLIPPEDINPDDGTILPGGRSYIVTDSYKRFDASASAMIYSDFFWAGVSIDNLVKKNIGFTDIETYAPVKTTIYGGYKIRYREGGRKHDEQSISLTANYFMQDKFRQLDIGAYWYINPLEMGLWYRGIPFATSDDLSNNDAIVMILGITFGNIRFSYSYDYTMSDLAGNSNGANEFAIMFRFNKGYKKKANRRAMPCSSTGTYGSGGSKYRRSSRKIF